MNLNVTKRKKLPLSLPTFPHSLSTRHQGIGAFDMWKD